MGDQPTREHILAVTRRLLSQPASAAGLTVGQVAAAAHISRATLYRYFPDKATLLRAAGVANGAAVQPPTARERILEATLAVVGERGMHAATLEEIASRAGLSRSGLQWHYKNKDELVADLVQYLPILPAVIAEAAQAEAATSDIETQLTRLSNVLLTMIEKYRGMLRFLLYEASVYPEIAQFGATHAIGRALPLLTKLFEEHARRGTLRPGSAQVRAQALMGMFMLLALLRPAFAVLLAADDRETAREYIDILLHGILAAPQEE
jgi:AcrR family transcriptional regulator